MTYSDIVTDMPKIIKYYRPDWHDNTDCKEVAERLLLFYLRDKVSTNNPELWSVSEIMDSTLAEIKPFQKEIIIDIEQAISLHKLDNIL